MTEIEARKLLDILDLIVETKANSDILTLKSVLTRLIRQLAVKS